MNLHDLTKLCADEAKAVELFERLRWPNGPVCPHCELAEGEPPRVYRLTGVKDKQGRERLGLWKCGHCRKQFTPRVGSIFEDSKIPISKWLIAIYMMCGSKKGVSAMQLQRALGVHYRTAWFMCHRVREAMREEPLASKLGAGGGIVELDETFVGGKPANNKRRRSVVMQSPRATGASHYKIVDYEDEFSEYELYDVPDWDGYGGEPITRSTIHAARALKGLLPMDVTPADIAPGGDGRIGFEWRRGSPSNRTFIMIDVGPDDVVVGRRVAPTGEVDTFPTTRVHTGARAMIRWLFS